MKLNNTLRRGISLFLVAMMAGAMLTGCQNETASGSSADSAPASTQQAEEQTVPATDSSVQETAQQESSSEAESQAPQMTEVTLPITAEKTELSLWLKVSNQTTSVISDPAQADAFQELCRRTNVYIDYVLASADTAAQDLMLMVSAGDYTDLIDSVESLYNGGADAAYSNEIIQDLTEVIDDYMPNYAAVLASNEEYYKDTINDAGQRLVIYTLFEEDRPVEMGTVIRQDWLDALKMDTPVTYDDFYDVLSAFKSNYGATLWLPSTGVPNGNYLSAGYGVANYCGSTTAQQPFYQVDGTVKYGPLEDETLDFLTMMHQWYTEGLIYPDFINNMAPFATDASVIADGSVGIWYDVTGLLAMHQSVGEAADPNFSLMPIPDAKKSEDETNHLRISNDLVDGNGICISVDCKDTEAAAKWMDYLYTDDGRTLRTWGLEGLTFEYGEDGTPHYMDLIVNNPDGLSEAQARSLYIYTGIPGITSWKASTSGYTEAQNRSIDVWLTSDADYNYPANVKFNDAAGESAELGTLYSDIKTYVQTSLVQFIVGEKPLSEFDAFRQECYDMGIEDCLKIYQDALDRYQER